MEAEKGSSLTLAEHNAFRFVHFDPELKKLEDALNQEIETIYRLSYWMPWCPTLPSGLDYFFFDSAVCHGVLNAIKALQRALSVEPDGHIGVITTAACIQAIRDKKLNDVLDAYALQRYSRQDQKERIEFALKHAKQLTEIV
jgi:lysozyme family protein